MVELARPRGASVAVAGALALALAACQPAPAGGWSGYAEGDYVYIAAPVAGRLEELAVQAGQQVAAEAPLFRLDATPEARARDQASAQVEAAQAQAANLQSGRRPDEIAQIQAQLKQAREQAALAQTDWQRKAPLVGGGAVSSQEVDAARTAAEQGRARVAELEAALRTARQPARVDERAAAQAQARAASSALAAQQWRVEETRQAAPAAGQVSDTYFRVGEWVPAGQPVVALLPPANIKARFFVPETEVATLHPGDTVQLACDGCGAPIAASVTRVATEAEYTPPVIYSNAQRAKLVFMAEARPAPADAVRLKPGLPLDVRRGGAGNSKQK